ncbi:MAG TPA: response regulator transcription factor [Novosphingobium sp.]|nr:response regulator transcription factor [Novosphingobium sp.]
MNYLVVEDDASLATVLCQGLASMGHTVDHAACGQSAIEACAQTDYDALVLDRTLPDMTGIEVIAGLHSAGLAPPVLMLSAMASVEERVEGLQAGADDYLAKPVDLARLNARLAVIAMRGRRWPLPVRAPARHPDLPPQPPASRVGRLRLDAGGRRLAFGGQSVVLNRKEYSLMAFLIDHVDKVVTRDMLLEHVWQRNEQPQANIIESNLSRLRRRLQTLGCAPIETHRGAGYELRSDRCA